MTKPRFSTLCTQAEKELQKRIADSKEELSSLSNPDLMVKEFFASGMALRMNEDDPFLDAREILRDFSGVSLYGYFLDDDAIKPSPAKSKMMDVLNKDKVFAHKWFVEGYLYENDLLKEPVRGSWNAAKWLLDFEESKKVYNGTRETRIKVWKSTLDIVSIHEYLTESGNIIPLMENMNIAEETVFYREEIARLNPSERFDTIVRVHSGDCLEFAKSLRDADDTDDLCVLNLASYRNPGGGVASGAGAQEEYLFRCSDYFRSLYQYANSFDCQKLYGITPAEEKYPLDENFGGIYSHGVTIFRDTEAKGYALLEEPWKVNFVAAAVPRLYEGTRTTPRHIVPIVENTIRTILRMAYVNGQRRLVLGALGCGAFHHPPREMAMTFKRIIAEPEFAGAFKSIHFAIFDDHNAARNGISNVETFKEVFEK